MYQTFQKLTQRSRDGLFLSLSFSDDESFVINTNEVATLLWSHLPCCETFFYPAWKEKKSSAEIQSAKRSDSSGSFKQVSSSFQTLSPLTLSSFILFKRIKCNKDGKEIKEETEKERKKVWWAACENLDIQGLML